MPVSICIDAVGAKSGGGLRVVRAILKAASEEAQIQRVFVCSELRRPDLLLDASAKSVLVRVRNTSTNPLRRMRWLKVDFANVVRSTNADVSMTLSGSALGDNCIPNVVFIQQALPFSPEALSTLNLAQRIRMAIIRWNMKQAAHCAARIMVQTHAMKALVQESIAIPQSQIAVYEPESTLGIASQVDFNRIPHILEIPYNRRLLYVGSAEPYKNLQVLAEAMPAIRAAIPGTTLFATVPKSSTLAKVEGVVTLPYCNDDDLRQIYDQATVLVFPSLVETVGMPLIEAMDAGLAVVAADRPYSREVLGNAALFHSPYASQELAEAVVGILSKMNEREKLIEAGKAQTHRRQLQRGYSSMLADLCSLAQSQTQRATRRQNRNMKKPGLRQLIL